MASKAGSVGPQSCEGRLCPSFTPPVLTLTSDGIRQERALETKWVLMNLVIWWLF